VALPAAETEDKTEDYYFRKAATERYGIGRPVILTLLARKRLIADAGFGPALLSLNLVQEPVKRHLRAIIAPLAQLPEDAAANKVVIDKHPAHLFPERLQLGIRARQSLIFGRSFGPYGIPDSIAGNACFFGNGACA